MSFTSYATTTKRSPFCGPCRKAGRNSTHYPTQASCCIILTWTCGYCKGKGHSTSRCSILADKKANEARIRREERQRIRNAVNAGEEVVVSRGTKQRQNKTDSLLMAASNKWGELEEDAEMPCARPLPAPRDLPTSKTAFPAPVPFSQPKTTTTTKRSWAQMATQPSIPTKPAATAILTPAGATRPSIPAMSIMPLTKPKRTCAWADSDDEDWEDDLKNDPFFA